MDDSGKLPVPVDTAPVRVSQRPTPKASVIFDSAPDQWQSYCRSSEKETVLQIHECGGIAGVNFIKAPTG